MSVPKWRRVSRRFGFPGVLLGWLLATWLGNGRAPSALAQPEKPPIAEANGTIAFTSPTAGSAQLLYLIDTKTQALAVYRVDPQGTRGSGMLKLEAARDYRWDLKLQEFNNLAPAVGAVQSMVRNAAVK